MARRLTFLDSGVLIAAFRGVGAVADSARELIDDPDLECVASDILRLELLPKPSFHRQTSELEFLEAYLAAATVVETTPDLVRAAESAAKQFGLSAADALHVAAAQQAGVEQLVTTERTTKPLLRVTGLSVVSLHPAL